MTVTPSGVEEPRVNRIVPVCPELGRRARTDNKKIKSYYVYIVEYSDSLLYTGITNDVVRRIEHNSGLNKNCFTCKRRPVELKFQEEFLDVKQAIYFEKKIKRWSADKK